jgi:RNA polymerase sigma-70 factor (ECF subfamily)
MVSWDPEIAERLLVVNASQHDRINVEDVAKALQKLSAEQREVLMLIGANGMSYDEAAEVMGCAIGTIKSRLARGRVALSVLINGPENLTDGAESVEPVKTQALPRADAPRRHAAMI